MSNAVARTEALLAKLGLHSEQVNIADDDAVCFRVQCPAGAAACADLCKRITAADWAVRIEQVQSNLDPNESQLAVTVPGTRTRFRRSFALMLVFGLLLMALALGGLYAIIWASGFHDPTAEWTLQLDRARAYILRAGLARLAPAPE